MASLGVSVALLYIFVVIVLGYFDAITARCSDSLYNFNNIFAHLGLEGHSLIE